MFVEAGHGRGDVDLALEVVLSNKVVQRVREGADFLDGGLFSFVSDGEFGEVGEGGEVLVATFLDEVAVEAEVVGVLGEVDDGRVGLVGLDEDGGGVEVAAADATDDLSEEFESFFFGGEVGEGKAGVGLDDADGGEVGEVEAAGDGLGADEDLDVAVFDFVVEGVEGVGFFVVGVEAGDFDFGEEFFKFGFEKFGAEAFVEDAGVVTFGAGSGDFFLMATGVTEEGVRVGVEGEGEEAVGTEGLPATVFADGYGGGTAAVVVDEGLVAVLEILVDGGEKRVGEVAVFGEEVASFKVDDLDGGGEGGGFGFLSEGNKRVFGFGEVEVGDERGGGAEEAGDFEVSGEEGGEADGGVFGGVFLEVGGFVSFVDNDETEVFEGSEEGGAGADDDLGLVGVEEVFPGEMTFGFGLFGVEEGDLGFEGGFEDLDELGGESDFGDEEDDGLAFAEGFLGEFEVDVGCAGAGDAIEQFGGVFDVFDFLKSLLLVRVEINSDL